MYRVIASSLAVALAIGGSASAAAWKSYADLGQGKQWFYDADYSYLDKASGRVVTMIAVGIPEKQVGPNGPGAADGVGSVVAINCKDRNQITLFSFSPGKTTHELADWRGAPPKKIVSDDDKALVTAACATTASLPTK